MGNGNLHLNNWEWKLAFNWKFGRNEILCAEENHSYMCHICGKGFLDLNINYALTNKISIFQETSKISHIHKNRKFVSIIRSF